MTVVGGMVLSLAFGISHNACLGQWISVALELAASSNMLALSVSLPPPPSGLDVFPLSSCWLFSLSHRMNMYRASVSQRAGKAQPSQRYGLKQIFLLSAQPKAARCSQTVVTVDKWLLKIPGFGGPFVMLHYTR